MGVLYRSTIAKNLVLYRESLRQWSNNKLRHPYGIEYPVVLFVVDTEKMPEARIAHIQRRAAEFGIAQDAPNLLLFTTAKALLEHNFLYCPWQNLKGKDVFLS